MKKSILAFSVTIAVSAAGVVAPSASADPVALTDGDATEVSQQITTSETAPAVDATTEITAVETELPEAGSAQGGSSEQEVLSSDASSSAAPRTQPTAGSSVETSSIDQQQAATAILVALLGVIGASAAVVQQGLVPLPKFSVPQVADSPVDVRALARQFGVVIPELSLPNFAPGQTRPAPAPAGQKQGSCEPAAFDAVVPGWPNFTGTVVGYCDGEWAVAGANQTDWIVYFHFVGDKWEPIKPVGTKSEGLQQGCYNAITLRDQGAPEEFVAQMPICTPAEITK